MTSVNADHTALKSKNLSKVIYGGINKPYKLLEKQSCSAKLEHRAHDYHLVRQAIKRHLPLMLFAKFIWANKSEMDRYFLNILKLSNGAQ